MTPEKTRADELAFSPIDNEAPLRWMRQAGLVPAGELGLARRAIFLALLTWLPIAVWAALTGHFLTPSAGEPLLQHYGVHVRCLVAIPLLVLAEGFVHRAAIQIVPQFLASGVVPPERLAQFEAVLRDLRRLRSSTMPWIFMIGLTLAWSIVDHPDPHADSMAWALERDGSLGFGGWWMVYVARPIFVALLLGWLWRLLLVTICFWRVGKLGLSLVPTHPDRVGGLAFVERLPGAFAPVTLAVAAVICSRWAHELVYHDAVLRSFIVPVATFSVLWTVLLLLPLLALAPVLMRARKESLRAYATLVGNQGRLVHRRWILGESVGDEALLDAPEIGPVADAAALYDAVKRMQIAPIGIGSLVAILLPFAVPVLAITLLRVPLKEVLNALLKALV
jgi:hypothetical protein